MTPSIVEGLAKRRVLVAGAEKVSFDDVKPSEQNNEPTLDEAAVGNPISHGQIVDLWKELREAGAKEYTLENLLRGARIYVPPPPPKPKPSNEYQALMARLRREEEQRAYERMTHPPPAAETFSQLFSHGARTHAFAEVNRPVRDSDMGDDDVTYNDVHRQLMLLLNFVVSILGVAATLWVVARWWSTPARLFLTMGGSILVGVAEVAVYSGYLWHLGEAKKKDGKVREVKEIMQTWVVGSEKDDVLTVDGGTHNTTDVDVVGDGSNLRRRTILLNGTS